MRCDTERAQGKKARTPGEHSGSRAMPLSDLEGVHAAYCALAATADSRALPTHACAVAPLREVLLRRLLGYAAAATPCMDAAETACRVSGEQHDALARRTKEVLEQARRTAASRPKRNRRGDIIWPQTLPFASITLPETIVCQARVFFAAAHAVSSCDRRAMNSHEKTGRGTNASAPRSPVPSATATTSVACLCAYAGGYFPILATGSCAWPCRVARPSPLHVITLSQQEAADASWFCSGRSGLDATINLRHGPAAAARGTLSSAGCMAARRLRGLLAASRMVRSRRR